MSYKALYRFLVSIRNSLNVLIAAVRARAYPETGGRRKRAAGEQTP